MKFERLRIVGFKTFVDPVEFVIEPGLTGVVGPNGCGKSNLVEALRWVMGESSYKAMRASGMDDVIFSGSGRRPARNSAEVTLVLGNDERRGPPGFETADKIEVVRRIEREAGSAYRMNGRDVRARDVQLLFADASTGARSPALVRQGQIGELIAAKPTQRRAILEEAAGISGLHTRRHEAELRLRAAETNLTRLEDVVREIDGRLEALKRQARQAARYRGLSGEIRKIEAAAAWIRFADVDAAVAEAERLLAATVDGLGDAQLAQAEAAREQGLAAHRLPGLREASAERAAALQRLRHALGESEAEERRVRERLADLSRRAAEVVRDRDREAALVAENDERLAALAEEAETLAAESAEEADRIADAEACFADVAAAVADVEVRLAEATGAHAEAGARRAALDRRRRELAERRDRLARDRAALEAERAAIAERLAGDAGIADAEADAEIAAERLAEAEDAAAAAEAGRAAAEAAERAARAPLAEAEREAQRLDTEARTLARVLNIENGNLFPPLVDALAVAAGFETALGAALGDDLEAPLDGRAPAHWGEPGPADGDPTLPDGAEPLSRHVGGPATIARRLAQIGVVDPADGPRLAAALRSGQRLVSRAGDLWRWDGYVAAAGAPTPAAQRLASRNRLAELDRQRAAAAEVVAARRADLQRAQTAVRAAVDAERTAREAVKASGRALAEARDRLMRAERAMAEFVARRDALADQLGRLAVDVEEAAAAAEEAEEAFADLPDGDTLAGAVQAARLELAERRAGLAEARAAVDGLVRDREQRARRRDAVAREREGWADRVRRAEARLDELAGRLDDVETERADLVDRPDEIVAARRGLVAAIAAGETSAREAAEALAEGERTAAAADRRAAEALARLSEIREGRGRAEERLAAARARRDGLVEEIRERFDAPVFALRKLAELAEDAPRPDLAGLDARLERLRQERDKLGGVNLQAEAEAAEVEARLDALVHEREDLIEAIRRLRQAISGLNKEARERLLAAFDLVDGHFRRLFAHLFGGGTAELQLVDADDPLEAGLEILARPPGKKPQTMTLLSGGEQALTAMALIFAVFLTNPAPICVLDEVDAPLDDANVERYCDLLEEMARATDTRFVVITHNPITMARMNRLFGVTMAERGVSQLVSVDLETAETFREAV
ncbi:chromosome segregation SMC family protein [Oharaeibacter diazotrophicus]|uniref:Chromosome partition protein Smc n=2 Tax=Oharaeibacter diazotrophicus TaxID=1920512 RepID=A0A4R6RCE7_9HYPH|nr:AAA family ATPase [Oharaeibacter diazotrophicus]TDP83367.1 condensin subunit Smc [Oharaeibacter diazotrophicus]BBE72200.1 chromosome partition protein Smc [Pleomorphomonas sp. SM30]GLS78967.1 hypothetical protein GCM10007904_43040 [Oharaeibacter diazotrophicus]